MQLDNDIKGELENKFLILSLLGKGGFGNVYECQDKIDHKKYAVKVISKINVKKSKIQTLKEEAKLLQSLSHENIVKIYYYEELEFCIYIKMEIASAGNLQTCIDKRKIEKKNFHDEQISKIMFQIFRGLGYIHSLSIIHRDIKPANILLQREENFDQVKIADFGLSTKLDSHYPKSAIAKCGTMPYMAPEILCMYTYTKAIDIWSAGILMYFLFIGQHPVWKKNMNPEDFKAVMAKRVIFPQIKNNKLAQDFLCRISKMDPNERYTAQQALRHPWLTRNFHDQIPLSIHQTYSGFSTCHEIVKIMKLFLAIKTVIPVQKFPIPKEYMLKLQGPEVKEGQYQLKLRKLRSLNCERDSFLTSFTLAQEKSLEQLKPKDFFLPPRESEGQNPTIMKLNQIFNTLFDKKITSKSKVSYREKDPPMDNFEETPRIDHFKNNIQEEIERSVHECRKSNKNKNRRILPVRQKDPTPNYNEGEMKEGSKILNNFRKSKYRNRINEIIKSSFS